MDFFHKILKYKYSLTIALVVLVVIKVGINNLLLAENGDTYDFFKVAYFIRDFNWDYQSKRMPLLPILLGIVDPRYFVEWGRIIINAFYFATVFVFYKYISLFITNDKKIYALAGTLVFATNFIIFENSFYILADTLFLFFVILFLYIFKKYKYRRMLLLSIIPALAFYTRPEGILLYLILGFSLLTEMLRKKNRSKIYQSRELRKLIISVLIGLLLVSPYLIRNIVYYDKLLYSGYIEDEAGFLFTTTMFHQRLANFLLGTGGFWLVPLGIMTIQKVKIKELITKILTNIELQVFILYSVVLFVWGPYIRLYTIPVALMILWFFTKLDKIYRENTKRKIGAFFLTGILALYYIYVVLIIDYKDLAYKKPSAILSLLLSGLLVAMFILGKKINMDKLLKIATFTIVFLNIFIFADKFRIIRYKYFTIYQAVETYQEIYVNEGNLAYANESGLEKWYLKDFSGNFSYFKMSKDILIQDLKEKNIKFLITTGEFGYNDIFKDFSNKQGIEVLEEYKSPFYEGSTKLLKVTEDFKY